MLFCVKQHLSWGKSQQVIAVRYSFRCSTVCSLGASCSFACSDGGSTMLHHAHPELMWHLCNSGSRPVCHLCIILIRMFCLLVLRRNLLLLRSDHALIFPCEWQHVLGFLCHFLFSLSFTLHSLPRFAFPPCVQVCAFVCVEREKRLVKPQVCSLLPPFLSPYRQLWIWHLNKYESALFLLFLSEDSHKQWCRGSSRGEVFCKAH